MKRNLILISILILGLSACKKWQHQYPEDTEKTKLTPLERISDKWWRLNFISLNGKDYTDTIAQNLGIYQFQLSNMKYSDAYYAYIQSENYGNTLGVWKFRDDESTILLAENGSAPPFASITPGYLAIGPDALNWSPFSWTILKLSDADLKLKITNHSLDSTIIMELSKQ